MFRNMTNTYKIIKNPEIFPGIFREGFVVYVLTTRQNNVIKNKKVFPTNIQTNLTIYTYHLLDCYQYNYNYFEELKNENSEKIFLPPKVLWEKFYTPEIYLPKETKKAMYKYKLPNVNLGTQTTFVLCGDTNFKRMVLDFTVIQILIVFDR